MIAGKSSNILSSTSFNLKQISSQVNLILSNYNISCSISITFALSGIQVHKL